MRTRRTSRCPLVIVDPRRHRWSLSSACHRSRPPGQGRGFSLYRDRYRLEGMLTHALEHWKVLRVCFHTDQRSRAALDRLGARFEAVLRSHRMAADYTPRDSVPRAGRLPNMPIDSERCGSIGVTPLTLRRRTSGRGVCLCGFDWLTRPRGSERLPARINKKTG